MLFLTSARNKYVLYVDAVREDTPEPVYTLCLILHQSILLFVYSLIEFSALTLLVEWQELEGHPASK